MNTLFLAPHNDDETLFGAFTLHAVKPLVIVCLRSQVQEDRGTGITAAQREAETEAAMEILGCEWRQWPETDRSPNWDTLRTWLLAHLDVDRVYAPTVEKSGHTHHNAIGNLALNVFGDAKVTSYLTYTRTWGRSEWGRQVEPTPDAIAAKHQALACYTSQIAEPTTRQHFLEPLAEYIA